MIISNSRELKAYQKATALSTKIYKILKDTLKPGIYPIEVDNLAKKLCQENGVTPAFQGVGHKGNTYDFATCISVNDTVVHGVPSSSIKLKVGDIVKLDFGIVHQGLFTDQCVTVVVGKFLDSKSEKLITTTKKAVLAAVAKAVSGNTTGDLGHTVHSIAKSEGFDVLKQYTGHGIGKILHEQPTIPAHGQPGTGATLKKGMVICVEAQLVTGSDKVYVADDGWTVKMSDGGNTAMFEYMVVVDNKKPKILTHTIDWPLTV